MGATPTDRDEECSSALYDLAHLCQVRFASPLSLSFFLPLPFSVGPANPSRREQKQQMSGRTLRRLPVLAHARHIGMSGSGGGRGGKLGMERWLEAMVKCVGEEEEQMGRIEES